MWVRTRNGIRIAQARPRSPGNSAERAVQPPESIPGRRVRRRPVTRTPPDYPRSVQTTPRAPRDERWYAALSARDARFDGRFWFGVTTTGIYCRPICPARTPGRDRVRFFESPAAASTAGFRPCKRCVPARSARSAPVDVREHVASEAVRRIEGGALNDGGRVGTLAAALGIGERQLRRIVKAAYGTTVTELARSARLRLATSLLADSDLSVTKIAFASGYGSLRRFNAEFLERNGRSPRELRRNARPGRAGTFELRVAYREPYAFGALLGWLGRHALPGAEVVDERSYARTLRLDGHVGWLRVHLDAQRSRLLVECADSLLPVVGALTESVRRTFDTDARADLIDALLARDDALAPDVQAEPGIRVPGSFDPFEPAWRGVVGQQVSVAAANTVSGRLCAQFGEPLSTPIDGLDRLGPEPSALAAASLESLRALGLTGARAESCGRARWIESACSRSPASVPGRSAGSDCARARPPTPFRRGISCSVARWA